jgi:GDPmannose 4,6-dehydratase
MTDGEAKTALIFGVGGQDGALLARRLVDQGWSVHGTSRDCEAGRFVNLARVGVRGRVKMHSATPQDFQSVLKTVDAVKPQRIFHLAAQSSVSLSFDQPMETLNSIVQGTVNILEAMRFVNPSARLYNACSSESFGDAGDKAATENTAFRPRSPYGVGKAAAFWAVASYRESYGLFACNGLMFNHESPLRSPRYVTCKIVRGAADIAEGRTDKLILGDLDVSRDWGWAPEYVGAMAAMLEAEAPDDFVLATGRTEKLSTFTAEVFARFGLDWKQYVVIGGEPRRPAEIRRSAADPSRAAERLGWRAKVDFDGVVDRLAAAEKARRVAGSDDGEGPDRSVWWEA